MNVFHFADLLLCSCCICYFIPPNLGFLGGAAAAAAKSLQSCRTLCYPIDDSPPHRRLPRPWDFPGKNTGVGCHFLLQCMKVKSESEVAQSCPTLRDSMDCMEFRPSVEFPRQECWSGVPSPSPPRWR